MKLGISGLFISLVVILQALNLNAQSLQTGAIIIELKAINYNDVAVNASSRESEVQMDPIANTTIITFDPVTLMSDNVEFDKAIEVAEFDPFIFKMIMDPMMLDFQSRQNEYIEATCFATINGITKKIDLKLLVTSKKTSTLNIYMLTGTGAIPLEIFELGDKLSILKEEIKFLFTQNITAAYR
ncbi:MAG: hypothetical protein ACJASM_001310 [Salibacteraceae bacterium]|jgi:hypothetical protein|tara:strand:+ start:270 stop:821 length:552 start_codon:yes stop_codon:yes gene_type:complete